MLYKITVLLPVSAFLLPYILNLNCQTWDNLSFLKAKLVIRDTPFGGAGVPNVDNLPTIAKLIRTRYNIRLYFKTRTI